MGNRENSYFNVISYRKGYLWIRVIKPFKTKSPNQIGESHYDITPIGRSLGLRVAAKNKKTAEIELLNKIV